MCGAKSVILATNIKCWVFAMAKTVFAGTVEKTGKNRGKNWQNHRRHKLMTVFITHNLQAVFDPYYNSGTDSEHK